MKNIKDRGNNVEETTNFKQTGQFSWKETNFKALQSIKMLVKRMKPLQGTIIYFVNLKSNLALLSIKGHDFWKSVSTSKITQNWFYAA